MACTLRFLFVFAPPCRVYTMTEQEQAPAKPPAVSTGNPVTSLRPGKGMHSWELQISEVCNGSPQPAQNWSNLAVEKPFHWLPKAKHP